MPVVPAAEPSPSASEVLRQRYTRRLPGTLGELAGPVHGSVQLPLHVAWSGLTRFDLDRPRSRMSMYRTVLAEGQHGDLITLLNRDLLIAQWPVLRTLISRAIRDVWEEAFPELVSARPAAAA
ncbi:hypothetical protein [Streptomyces hygroscopicus]|uniref:hypothetical protein n=1 Tax=Streptomyces hygroscopicus TaxID=1912 RepID=UPI0007833C24|nr:hypothetical protein [Streptomyces hygroscopicus]MBW8094132.1 hypothetical protein [Streptomyces hygroscopicus subsp. hygroscopicus]